MLFLVIKDQNGKILAFCLHETPSNLSLARAVYHTQIHYSLEACVQLYAFFSHNTVKH